MAVVESTFTTTANQNWASSTWDQTNDPSGKLHTALDTWINALSGTDKFTIEIHPGSAGVSRASGQRVRWILKSTVGGGVNNDYGFQFFVRLAETGAVSDSMAYHSRTAGTSNNGSGTYTSYGPNPASGTFTSAQTCYIQYESSGSTPWFAFSHIDTSNPSNTTRIFHAITKLDTSSLVSGSYYPTTGLGKWLYIASSNVTNYSLVTPSINTSAPVKGITSGSGNIASPNITPPSQNGYFFRMPPFIGEAHYLGTVTPDWLIANDSTGVYGDTATVNGISYRCLRRIWVRIS